MFVGGGGGIMQGGGGGCIILVCGGGCIMLTGGGTLGLKPNGKCEPCTSELSIVCESVCLF